jgi:hypothetical protein
MAWGGTVTAPDGSRWRVGRRWLERRPPQLHKRLRLSDNSADFAWFGAELADGVGSLVGAAGLVILVAVVIVVVLPILGLAIELVLLLLILLFGLVARLCFGRPWVVEAAPIGAGRGHEERERVVRKVRGWRASGEEVARLRRQIEVSGRPAVPGG